MDRSNYIIRVRGRLDEQWSGWFEGMRISLEDDGTTVLSGYLEDQAALFGVLKKIRDLGLPCPQAGIVPYRGFSLSPRWSDSPIITL